MPPALIFYREPRIPFLQVRLTPGLFVLGSDPACDFLVHAAGVAARHLQIEHVGDRVRVRMLDPQGEVRVNGALVDDHWLRGGETIGIGPHLLVEFREQTFDDEIVAAAATAGEPDSPEQAFQFLRGQVLFYTMPDDSLRRIASRTRLLQMQAGATVVRQGEAGNSFYLIRSGFLEVLKNGQRVAELGPNQFFGEVALLQGGIRAASVVARARCDLYELDREGFDAIIHGSPAIAKHFLRLLAGYGEGRQAAQETLEKLMPPQRRLGLALAAGAASGLVELGVLKVLEEEKIPIHMIAGCSVGALIGAAYSLNGSYQETYDMFARFTRTQKQVRQQAMDFSWFPWRGLLKGNRMFDLFRQLAGENDDFAKLKIPFRAVAAELDTGREVVFKEGPATLAVRASISIPAVVEPIEIDGKRYVDGGIVNPLPVSVLAQEGIDVIIAVMARDPASNDAGGGSFWSRNFFNVLASSLSISVNQMRQLSASIADLTIAPYVSNVGMFDFHRLDELVAIGEQAAREKIEQIRQLCQVGQDGR